MTTSISVDVPYFWEKGYTIVRNVYSASDIARFRDAARATRGKYGDLLSNPRLRETLVDGRMVEIARQILGNDEIVYAGDSSFTIDSTSHGYHKDNADRTDPE